MHVHRRFQHSGSRQSEIFWLRDPTKPTEPTKMGSRGARGVAVLLLGFRRRQCPRTLYCMRARLGPRALPLLIPAFQLATILDHAARHVAEMFDLKSSNNETIVEGSVFRFFDPRKSRAET
jgi:hypothetical protein